ncbi:K02A2.6-like [Cordylochernes scorpioides]|uniref:K02A2.6-like n=1 Tax=Cordylochernes scorpioides TaxID=51811 RepID=A0ABY6KSZ5_9ARAC|nr:K02A2.6-like [Cordylochernes scorpioides]
MESNSFLPPPNFSFDAKDLPSWKQRFSRYRLLSNLNAKEQEYQITALIYLMGERAEEIYSAFNLSADDAKNLDKVIEAFDNHFMGKRNVVYERALFGLRSQRPEKTIEEFVIDRTKEADDGKKNSQLASTVELPNIIIVTEISAPLRTKSVETREKVSFVYAVRETMLGSIKTRWKSTVKVNGTAIHFKLDPGSDVTLIPFSLYKRYFGNIQLTLTDGQLRAAANQRLENAGTFVANLRANTREVKETVYVVHHLEQPLLGVGACEDLQLVKRINLVINGTTDVNPERKFPKLFEGLGLLEQPYHIKLKEGAKPFSIPVPRRVPLPLMPKLKEQLDAMVAQEVIEPVDESTEWCASIILAGKPNGKIRICVDLSRLNLSVEPLKDGILEMVFKKTMVLRRLKNSGITLNKEECQFGVSNVTFLGHYIDEHGIKTGEKKVKAIAEMKPPTDVHGVQRFMGMVNFLGHFVPNLVEITKPLNDLRKKDGPTGGTLFFWLLPNNRSTPVRHLLTVNSPLKRRKLREMNYLQQQSLQR